MALEWVGKHDEHDNRGTSNCSGNSRGVHANDVASNFVAKRQVACDRHQDESCGCATNASEDNGRCAEVAVILDLVENRKHLEMDVSNAAKKMAENVKRMVAVHSGGT